MLTPVETEAIIGEVEVRALFSVSRLGTIAGCMVTSGVVRRGSHVRIFRDGARIHETTVAAAQALQGRRPRGDRGLRVRHPARGLQRPARGRRLRGLRDARGRAHLARRAAPAPTPPTPRLAARAAGLRRDPRRPSCTSPRRRSLKGKRKYVRSAKAQLQNRFGAVGGRGRPSRALAARALTAAFVAREAREAEELAGRRRALARRAGVGARALRAPDRLPGRLSGHWFRP